MTEEENQFEATSVAMVAAFCYEFPELTDVLQEYLDYFDGELIEHLLMSDFVRWMIANVGSRPGDVQRMWDWLEEAFKRAFERGDNRQQEVLWQSAVGMLPDYPEETGFEMREMLGPNLKFVAENWRVLHTPDPTFD